MKVVARILQYIKGTLGQGVFFLFSFFFLSFFLWSQIYSLKPFVMLTRQVALILGSA